MAAHGGRAYDGAHKTAGKRGDTELCAGRIRSIKISTDAKTRLAFLLASTLGVLVFLTPVEWDGSYTIGIGIITGWVRALMGEQALLIVVVLVNLTAVLSLIGSRPSRRRQQSESWFDETFNVAPVWLALRLASAFFSLVYFFQAGPELLQSEAIGGAVYLGIATNVLAVYISACLLLPLLTDFGLMEFVGTLLRKVFQRAFRLPGRAAIDAIASFVGASAIGLLITIGQYNRGNYTARHASIIATNFSVVSIPFSLVVATVAGIGHLFIGWYVVVVTACLLAALITPRLPPLSKKPDTRIDGSPAPQQDAPDAAQSLPGEAWAAALQRAGGAPGPREFLVSGAKNLLFFAFSVIPAAMALATIAAILTFHTPLFTWLGYPFIALLEMLGLPDAAAAAPGLFAGFMDQYMPAVVASGIDSDLTSFVLAGLSVCQLIFMSEVGVIILRSGLPLTFTELAVIFLQRTVIVTPVLIVGAHLVAA